MNELLAQINLARAQARSCGGVNMPVSPAVAWNSLLASAASRHSVDMASHNWFDHDGTDGSSFDQRIYATGYRGMALAENIAAGSSTATATVRQWLNSPPHCQEMMSATYTEIGASCAYNSTSTYRYYWTLDLGRR